MVLRSVIRNFLKLESSSGILLLLAGVIALILSNSNLAEDFNGILHLKLYFGTNSDGSTGLINCTRAQDVHCPKTMGCNSSLS